MLLYNLKCTAVVFYCICTSGIVCVFVRFVCHLRAKFDFDRRKYDSVCWEKTVAPYWKGMLYAKVGKKLTKFHEHGHHVHVFVLPKTRVAEQPKPLGSAEFVLKSNLEAVTQCRSNHVAVFAILILLPHVEMDIIFFLVTVLTMVHNNTKQVQIHLP